MTVTAMHEALRLPRLRCQYRAMACGGSRPVGVQAGGALLMLGGVRW